MSKKYKKKVVENESINDEKHKDKAVEHLEINEWPFELIVLRSRDISRQNLLELRISEITAKKLGIANGTICVILYIQYRTCVTLRILEPQAKLEQDTAILGNLVLNNLNIKDISKSTKIKLIPLKKYTSDKNICNRINLKFHSITLNGIYETNETIHYKCPEWIKSNANTQKLIMARCRGICIFEGNLIPIFVAGEVIYFNIYNYDKTESGVIRIGTQTKIDFDLDSFKRDLELNKDSIDNLDDSSTILNFENINIGNSGDKQGFAKIGGMNYLKNDIKRCLLQPLRYSQIYSLFGVSPVKGILLYGPPGTGKTLIARCIAEEVQLIQEELKKDTNLNIPVEVHFIVLNGSSLVDDNDEFILNSLHKIGENSKRQDKDIYSILFIDEIDMVCANRENFEQLYSNKNKKILSYLLTLLDGFNQDNKIILIASTNKPNDIDPALRRAGRIDREISVEVPNSEERFEILKVILENIPNTITDVQLKTIVDVTQAFVGADLNTLIKESINRALSEYINKEKGVMTKLSFEDIIECVKDIKPSALRELSIEIPKTLWSDIGGYEDVKQQLKECVEWPIVHFKLFNAMKIKPPSGVLLYGPPGCSKTLMAKAVATESKMNFISVKGPELFSKWVGESEKAIREVFRKARQNSPCVIFFDEIDALGTSRENSNSSDSVSSRVLSQMLNEMDGITTHKQIIIIGATNRPDLLDSALLRPGRLDRLIYVGLPDEMARIKILDIYLKHISSYQSFNTISDNEYELNLKIDKDLDIKSNSSASIKDITRSIDELQLLDIKGNPPKNYDEMIKKLAKLTDGYSGAEISLLCREAAMHVIRKVLNRSNNSDSNIETADIDENMILKISITWNDIIEAKKKVKSRIPKSLIEFYINYSKKIIK
ncbi:ATPase, AAA family protein [Cryptosporidium serpentis]